MSRTATIFVFVFCLVAGRAFAQERGGTYVDIGLAGISTEVSGIDIASYSVSFDLEKNFSGDKLHIFSGWSMGYRYEPSYIQERGHHLNAKFFKVFRGPAGLRPKAGLGVEWGYPTLNYDRTVITHINGSPVKQEYVFLGRNSTLPVKGVGKDMTTHLFIEASAEKRLGRFSAEVGVRGTFTDFIYREDDFSGTTLRLNNQKKILPSFFARLGIRIS